MAQKFSADILVQVAREFCRLRMRANLTSWRIELLLRTNSYNNLSARSSCYSKFLLRTTINLLMAARLLGSGLFRWPIWRKAATNKWLANDYAARQKKVVGYWLCGMGSLTVATVSLGGITRLTKSGLSMVDWHPFNEFPPKTDAQWEQEFERYKKYPEFQLRNSDIMMQDFKWIWYMEYIHRSFGRLIGLTFFLPAAYFGYKGYFKGRVRHVIAGMGGLILFQGALGWYMVKSGLEEKPADYSEPRVSHLRLAAHLGTAFLFFSTTALTAMHHLLPPEKLTRTASLLTLKRCAYGLTGAIFATALSGALVAGMEAGLTYNSWPMMADRWIPTDLFAKSPLWRNFIDNSTTVQFDHRWLGQLTFLSTSAIWLYTRRLPLTPQLRFASNLVMLLACFQLSLGVSTLLLYVPKHLAATHQAGALALLTSSLYLSHQLKMVRRI